MIFIVSTTRPIGIMITWGRHTNLGLKFYGVQFNTNGSATIANADKYFVEGDELVADNKDLAWVKSVNGNTVTFMNEMGNPFKPAGSVISMTIVRSGRKI